MQTNEIKNSIEATKKIANTNIEIFKCETVAEATRKATESLNEALAELSAAKVPTLLMLSGGSSFNLLHGVEKKNLGPHLTICALDERFSEDSTVNHSLKISHSLFYHHALELDASFIDTSVKLGDTYEHLAKRFEEALFTWSKENPNGKVVATMGIGYDGHVAGIMPFPESPETFNILFESKEHWVVGYDAGLAKTQYPLRVTTNMTFLRDMVDFSVTYVTGEEKIAALTKAVEEQGTIAETPGRVLREMKHVRLFTNI